MKRTPAITLFSALLILLLTLAACSSQAATPTQLPSTPEPETATGETQEEETMSVTNAVTVSDQQLGENNTITVNQITADAAGWIVIHAQADGKPGPILGFAPVAAGENTAVTVQIDPQMATATLYAMLHVDEGTAGEFEFPDGPDVPAKDAEGNIVTPPFAVEIMATATNSVAVSDQQLGEDNTVTIDSVTADADGWIVIHAQADGKPGPILGFSPVSAGENTAVTVQIDPQMATDTLYAMLHVDEGETGEFEFPDGPDVPAKDAAGNVVTPPFAVEIIASVTNAVTVSDQQLGEDNTVTIDSVTADTDGWIVIHAQADGKPGPILGFAPVTAGENNTVLVEIDPEAATDTLYAMLHVDEGAAGEFEFPDGPDVPAKDAADNIVTPSFAFTIPTVQIGGNDTLGPFLVARNGMTLYTFANDANGKSVCYGECATNWPPLLVAEGETPTAVPGISGELGTTTRDDGTLQVTYNGSPLYFWFGDQNPGDAFGNGLGNVWFVITP